MLNYLDVALNAAPEYADSSVVSVYVSPPDSECSKGDHIIVWPFYGTKTLCQEHGQLKYDTCSSESGGYEISGFETANIEVIPGNRQLCARLSNKGDFLYAPLAFREGEFVSDSFYSNIKVRLLIAELSDFEYPCLTEEYDFNGKV